MGSSTTHHAAATVDLHARPPARASVVVLLVLVLLYGVYEYRELLCMDCLPKPIHARMEISLSYYANFHCPIYSPRRR